MSSMDKVSPVQAKSVPTHTHPQPVYTRTRGEARVIDRSHDEYKGSIWFPEVPDAARQDVYFSSRGELLIRHGPGKHDFSTMPIDAVTQDMKQDVPVLHNRWHVALTILLWRERLDAIVF